jgi:hypothetical protein
VSLSGEAIMTMHRVPAVAVCLIALAVMAASQATEPAASQPADVNPSLRPLTGPRRFRDRLPRPQASRPARADRPGRGERAGPEVSLLTDEQIERLMTFLEVRFPLMHQRLENARERDPAQFQRMINRAARFMFPIIRAAQENPELAEKMIAEHKSQLEIRELRDRYARTRDPAEQASLREQIRQQMEAGFEARIERLRLEVARLQQRLDDARGHLARQEQNKSRLIDERLSDLLSQGTPRP